jgi:hypothetical protein
MLDMWPLEAYPCFSNTNDFLKVAKRPLKGWHPSKLGFYLCKSEILKELFYFVKRGNIRVVDP